MGLTLPATPDLCRFDGDRLPHAPRVLALDTRLPYAATPAQEREHARALARTALCQAVAPLLGCPPDALHISDTRGQPPRPAWADGRSAAALGGLGLSISHAPGLSLAAWHLRGPVGVDVQAVPRAATAAELLRTAALFLGPKSVAALVQQAHCALFFEVFAHHWARHEAALKCVGQALAEYSPALAAQLTGVHMATLVLPPWASADVVAALAWRPSGDASTAGGAPLRTP